MPSADNWPKPTSSSPAVTATPWANGGVRSESDSERIISPELTATGRTYPAATADLWLDPLVARQMVDLIRLRLAIRDPRHEADYRANADIAIQKLDALEAKLKQSLAPLQGRRFLVLRPSWTFFARHYGLEEIAPVDTHGETFGDAEVRQLRAAAKQEKCRALVVDAYLANGAQRQLQSQTGLKIIPLDRLGSSAPDARSTYERIMEYNLEQLVKGLNE